MAVQSGKPGEEQQVPPIAIGAAVIFLIAIIAFLGYKNFGPQPEPPKTKAMESWDDYMKGVAAYTHGDPSKLKKEDYEKIKKQTSGFGIASEVRKYAGFR